MILIELLIIYHETRVLVYCKNVLVIDDGSSDGTLSIVKNLNKNGIEKDFLIKNKDLRMNLIEKGYKKWNGKARKGIEPLKKPADLISDSFSPFALSLLGILFSSDTFGQNDQNLTIFNTTCIMSKFFTAS